MAKSKEELKREKSAKEKERDNLVAENKMLDDQIDRLKSARDAVKAAKSDYNELKKSTRSSVTNHNYDWKGTKFNDMERMFADLEVRDKHMYDHIDAVLDKLEMDIAKKENKKLENLGLIGTLTKAINTLWHKIRTWTN